MATRTLIVVDDIPFARRVVKDILTAAKYTVVAEAENGEEAIQLYHKLKPDGIVMDVVMPLKGGIEATRRITEESNGEARVVLMSAIAHEHLLMEAISAGARDFILKPFSKDDLLKAVDKAMQSDDILISKDASAPKAEAS